MKTTNWLVAIAVGSLAAVLNSRAGSDSALADDAASRVARTRSGLQVLYDFSSTKGSTVKDRSGVGSPLDLRITDSKAVRRRAGALEVRGKTLIRSDNPASKVYNAVRRSGEMTLEAWIQPAKADQSGPARIVTLSKNPSERNFTLGQDGDRFDVRFRTTKTSTNGLPSTASPRRSLRTRLTHLVYIYDRPGRTRIYIDGKQRAESKVSGSTNNWNGSYRLALANELSGDRAWLGTFHLVAIYSRALSPQEVAKNFRAGAKAGPAQLAGNQPAPNAQLFERQIAPLLANHCLECHDSASREGGLDLSRKTAALAGGDGGKAIVPGKASESLLWEMVESDEMPVKRPPLSAKKKSLLREWIDGGATWPVEFVDPAVYTHEGRADQIWLQRLTIPEYVETVRSAVGVDISQEANELLPPDLRADGFSNTAYNLGVDLKHVDAYAKLAEIIVGRMDAEKFASRYSRSKRLTDDNMRDLIAKMGKWLLRGPLEEREIVTYRGISTTVASAGGNFEEAVSLVIEAMLQSPRFIYRIESQQGDGTAWPVGDYELASRLSYIIWGGPPDQELMQAADAGELSDRARVAGQVQRMLDDPRAVRRSKRFIYQWLNLGRLDNMRPNADKFPNWDPQLAADMREETLAFFEDIAWKQKRPLADLLNAQVTYLTPRLAKHYGLKPKSDELARYEVSSTPRGGLLTQGSVLTVGGDEASMVSRGLFVLHDLLRGTVKDPPPCVNTTPVPTKAGLTQRGIAEARIANANCGGCHVRFEPLAFGLEKFDGLGTFHEQDEHGNRLRDDGEILFPGTAKPVKYQSSSELMDLLAQSDRVRETITWKLTQYALGRPLISTDTRIVREIHDTAQKNGGTYSALITAIVLSDLVQMSRTEID